MHSVRALRSGIGFGLNEASVKALEMISLSGDSLGGDTDEDGNNLPGYGLSFNFYLVPRTTGHLYTGTKRGMFLGPDKPHGANHKDKCRKRFNGLSSCEELTGMNLNPHEQNHSKKTKHLPSLCNTKLSG